jgi:hypothetical protein
MAYSFYLNRSLKTNNFLLGGIDAAIQVRSHVDLTFYSLVGSRRSGEGPPRLLSSLEVCLMHIFMNENYIKLMVYLSCTILFWQKCHRRCLTFVSPNTYQICASTL